jgi:DNA-binding CsgD family transcriptional regulator
MYQIHENTHFQRVRNGIKLLTTDTVGAASGALGLLDLPFNCYFINHESNLVLGNDITLINHNLYSIQDAIGHNISELIPNHHEALRILANDRSVRENDVLQFLDETYHVSTETVTSYLSIKMPVYNERDLTMGVFGCSMLLNGANQVVDFLNCLTNLGILNASPQLVGSLSVQPKHAIFSPRELQILQLANQAYTSKQISTILKISYRTVECHIRNAKAKVDAYSKRELLDKVFS